jgi:small subunit ribosomal protein S6
MNTYELTLITANKSEMKEITKLVTEFVKAAKGEIKTEDEWGEKTLAYPIKKLKTGVYMHYVLALPPEAQPKLAADLRIQENLLRSLFVRVE